METNERALIAAEAEWDKERRVFSSRIVELETNFSNLQVDIVCYLSAVWCLCYRIVFR